MTVKNFFPSFLLFSFSLVACTDNPSTSITKADEDSIAVVPPDSSVSYGPDTNRPEAVQLVTQSLKTMYKKDLETNLIDSFSRTFTIFEYDLNEDGKKEIFVSHTGPYFCGSGGCTITLLSPDGNKITQFTVSRTPVIVSRERSNGWNDLLLESAGKLHLLQFNGKTYPSNPSTAPVFNMIPGDGLPRLLDTEREAYPTFSF
jgi:hypothetical protein